mgnify:CR=1 FL=1
MLEQDFAVMREPIALLAADDDARRIFERALHPKSFVSLDDADHLLSREVDARYAAGIIASGKSTYDSPVGAVVGSDTIVVVDGDVLGKPRGRDHAIEMLMRLSGREHEVCTGVAVARGDRVESGLERVRVRFRALDRHLCEAYVDTRERESPRWVGRGSTRRGQKCGCGCGMVGERSGYRGPTGGSGFDVEEFEDDQVLDVAPDRLDDPTRDRFLLSIGHYAIALYAVLMEAGILPEEETAREGGSVSGKASGHSGRTVSRPPAPGRTDGRWTTPGVSTWAPSIIRARCSPRSRSYWPWRPPISADRTTSRTSR